MRVIGYDDLSEYAGKKRERDLDQESSSFKKETFHISEAEDLRTSVYVSRFLESSGSSSFQVVRNQSIFKRYLSDVLNRIIIPLFFLHSFSGRYEF